MGLIRRIVASAFDAVRLPVCDEPNNYSSWVAEFDHAGRAGVVRKVDGSFEVFGGISGDDDFDAVMPLAFSSVNFGAVASFAASQSHVLLLRADGSLWEYGTRYSFVGFGLPLDRVAFTTPTRIGGLPAIKSVSVGSDGSTVALDRVGQVWAWGLVGINDLGLLSSDLPPGSNTWINAPVRGLPGFGRWDKVWKSRQVTWIQKLISLVMAVLVFAWEVDDDWNRLGVALTIVTALCGVIYRVIPFGFRLWNNQGAALWLMGTFLLASMGVYAVGEFVVRGVRLRSGIRQGLVAEHPAARVDAMLGAVVVTHAAIALPLGAVPGSFPAPKFTKLTTTTVPENGGTPVTTQVGSWLVGLQRADDSADFNQSTAKGFPPYAYQGYENLGANWVDYSQIIEVMKQVGVDHGCGRAQWEAEGEQRRWGTSMALMLLPYWTDSCIGSMEGLYFESSPTTPYHWMNTSLLSKAPSNPQRELPYQGLNVAEGVKKLQQWGVRYYMAFSPAAIAQADQVADLQLLKTAKYQRVCLDPEVLALSCPSMWKIYLVQRSEIVEALRVEPAVVNGIKQNQTGGWLDLAAAQYSGRVSSDVPFAADGPTSWQRIQVASSRSRAEPTYGNTVSLSVPTAIPLPRAVVSNVVTSFSRKAPRVTLAQDRRRNPEIKSRWGFALHVSRPKSVSNDNLRP